MSEKPPYRPGPACQQTTRAGRQCSREATFRAVHKRDEGRGGYVCGQHANQMAYSQYRLIWLGKDPST